ncbi:MAG: class I SAM-dependent rRNA methyltransferase [Mucinivorans sp.]
MVTIKLKRGKQESLLRNHPWIFSGAIHSSSAEVQEGEMVQVYTADDKFIAQGHSAIGSIAVRVLSFSPEPIDQTWWNERVAEAYALRVALHLSTQTNCYRLIHGEGDSLPGLVVDIYDTVAVVQCHTVGMYLSIESIVETLKMVLGSSLTAIYHKSNGTLPPKSEIQATEGYIWGSYDESREQYVMENGLKFRANWEGGQKTGFFLDQRDNRALVGHYATGRRVLNTFCYTGGFSLYALAGGATMCDSVDSSAKAMDLCTKNIELNFPGNTAHGEFTSDTLEFMRDMGAQKYDLIILDPPAYAKHHSALPNALQGYKRLNAKAFEKIAPGGILFTFSCSQAVSRDQFRTVVFSAAAIAGRRVRILHQMSQGADHPINIFHPEGEYLKGLVLFVE